MRLLTVKESFFLFFSLKSPCDAVCCSASMMLSMIVWCVFGAVVAPSWQVAVSGAVVCAELNICGSVVEPGSSSSQSATDHLMSSHNHHFRHGPLDDQTASQNHLLLAL